MAIIATFIYYLLCHIYPGVPHQCAALFSLGLLHYMHDKTNINQHTFSYNTVTTLTMWYIHHYMHNVNYSSTCHERPPRVRSESGPSWQVAAGYRDINMAKPKAGGRSPKGPAVAGTSVFTFLAYAHKCTNFRDLQERVLCSPINF